MATHGQYGQENRKFLSGIYKPKEIEVCLKVTKPSNLPLNCDLRVLLGTCFEIYNQGRLGSCTANAIAHAYRIMCILRFNKEVSISRLFVYYNERVMIGKVYEDSGAFIKDGFLSMQSQGSCLEKYWPYIETKFTSTPPAVCYNEARLHRTHGYNSQLDPTDQVQSIKQWLVLKLPVVIGIMVYASFMTDECGKTGIIPVPNPHVERFVGGHALVSVGYDDIKQHFIVLNSWSSAWGDGGYCYIPYQYVANTELCNDCHAFSEVELKLLSVDEDPQELTARCMSLGNCQPL
jgi:C1A family cysteine protease